MLNSGHRATETEPLAQLGGEGVGHPLVSAFDPEDFRRPQRDAAQMEDRPVPDHVKRRSASANVAKGGRGSALLFEQVSYGDLIQSIQPGVKGPVLVLEPLHIGLKV